MAGPRYGWKDLSKHENEVLAILVEAFGFRTAIAVLPNFLSRPHRTRQPRTKPAPRRLVTPEILEQMKALRADGLSSAKIARHFNLNYETVRLHLKGSRRCPRPSSPEP